MFPLNENLTKTWLREMNCPVPAGAVANTPQLVAAVADELRGKVVVKALIPTGRRGKAGGVLAAEDAKHAADLSQRLLGSVVNGYTVREVLVEEKVDIDRELFLSFTVAGRNLDMLISGRGGVDIEAVMSSEPNAVVRAQISPINGVSAQFAMDQWSNLDILGDHLPALAELTSRLYDAFVKADGLILELNPIAITDNGNLCIVGSMLAIDKNALFRHQKWVRQSGEETLPDNERERRVTVIDRSIPGGECQYIELGGDIGLLVGGGGAGLYQHDLVLAAGRQPANHSVTPPTGSDSRKMRAVVDAILQHPRIRGLLVGFNFSQMSRVDIRVRAVVEALKEARIDTRCFPVVIRAFGAGEAEARALVADLPNVHYLQREATLKDAVTLITELVPQDRQGIVT